MSSSKEHKIDSSSFLWLMMNADPVSRSSSFQPFFTALTQSTDHRIFESLNTSLITASVAISKTQVDAKTIADRYSVCDVPMISSYTRDLGITQSIDTESHSQTHIVDDNDELFDLAVAYLLDCLESGHFESMFASVVDQIGGMDQLQSCLSCEGFDDGLDVSSQTKIVRAFKSVQMTRLHGCSQLGDWNLGPILGMGSSAVVRRGTNVNGKQTAALKIFAEHSAQLDMSRLDREVKSMLMLEHENIAQLIQVLISDNQYVIVSELCDGETLFQSDNEFDEIRARSVFTLICETVAYCHQQGVCHRDLRGENIIISKDDQIKILDFGHAGLFENDWDIFATITVGSFYRLTPEQIVGQAYSGRKLDVWALGLILFELLTGELPFHGQDSMLVMQSIQNEDISFHNANTLSQSAQNLVRQCLEKDAENRPSVQQILEHDWMQLKN